MIARYCDTHAHINGPEYAEDRRQVVESSLEAGLAFIIDVGTDAETSAASLDCAATYPNVYATVGVHPHEAKRYSDSELRALLAMHDRPRCVAVGEMGLDYYYDHSPRERQREVYALQLEFALRHNRPAIVHARDAVDDAIAIPLKDFRAFPAGVFHCFSGNYRQAVQLLDAGMYLSFGGPVTFKKNDDLRELIAKLPLSQLLIETDCPYLTPVPHRGKRNKPEFVKLVVDEIAKARKSDAKTIARATTANARLLFGIPAGEPVVRASGSRGGAPGSKMDGLSERSEGEPDEEEER